MITFNTILLLILILHLEKQLAILDGELRNHHTRPEHIAVHCDAVVEDPRESPAGLQPPI